MLISKRLEESFLYNFSKGLKKLLKSKTEVENLFVVSLSLSETSLSDDEYSDKLDVLVGKIHEIFNVGPESSGMASDTFYTRLFYLVLDNDTVIDEKLYYKLLMFESANSDIIGEFSVCNLSREVCNNYKANDRIHDEFERTTIEEVN